MTKSETEGDKWRAFVKEILRMILPVVMSVLSAYYATSMAQKGTDRVEGRLDAHTNREQWGRSDDYINGLVEETVIMDTSKKLATEPD